jgi:hypothetical protein
MKLIYVIVAILICATTSIGEDYTTELRSVVEQHKLNTEEFRENCNKFTKLITEKGETELIVKLSDKLIKLSIINNTNCLTIFNDYGFCGATSDIAKAAQMKLAAAKYALEQGNKAVAKQQYRDIIITFTGPAYASYVKQAEFGLEDLK